MSEACRHVPDDLKALHPEILWRRVADLGNQLRHTYHRMDFDIVWAICTHDLAPLKAAIVDMAGRRAARDD